MWYQVQILQNSLYWFISSELTGRSILYARQYQGRILVTDEDVTDYELITEEDARLLFGELTAGALQSEDFCNALNAEIAAREPLITRERAANALAYNNRRIYGQHKRCTSHGRAITDEEKAAARASFQSIYRPITPFTRD